MVDKGKFIDYVISLDNIENIVYPTETQIIIELAKKIKELEARIVKLEK